VSEVQAINDLLLISRPLVQPRIHDLGRSNRDINLADEIAVALAKEHTEHLRVRVTGVLQRLDIWMCIYPEHSDVPTVSLVEIRDWGQIDETVASDCKNAIRCVLFDRGPR
jgi:hypothetical protein